MTIIYNHISHSAQCHNILACFLHIHVNITESLMFHNCHTYSNIAHIESISPYQTPYKVVNFINLHNVNRMSNYIIHSFEEVTGYFA